MNGTEVGQGRHVCVVECDVEEDRCPEDAGQHKKHDSETNQNFSHVFHLVRRALLVVHVDGAEKVQERTEYEVPYNSKRICNNNNKQLIFNNL